MKLVKSLLLGSAAGLAATVGAQAADLPFRKAAPVEYVRVCDWTGAGYFYIPGSDTCLGLSGFVRAEYAFVNATKSFSPTPSTAVPFAVPGSGTFTPARAKSTTGYFIRGQINFDARTQTAYGLLRSYFRIQADRTSGNYNAGGAATNVAGSGAATSSAYVDKGYITFAGFTAGRIQSFFDLYADDFNFEGIANSDESAQVLAYTATFGGGFSATISVEDPNGARRDGIGTVANGIFAANAAVGAVPAVAGSTVSYGGFRYPDAVLQVRDDQAWGAVQISAAYHDINTISSTTAAGPHNDQSGFAVQGGVDLKLPMLAAGDELFIEGAYQSGAYLYQDSGTGLNTGFYGANVGGFQHNDVDAVAIATPGGGYSLSQGKGFSVMAAIHHYFTPQFHDVLYGSYEEISYGAAKNYDWTRGGLGDGSEFRVGNQFLFTPVHNMTIGLDIMYAKINQTLAHDPGVAPSAVPFGVKINPDSFQARLRLERDF